MSGVFDDFLMDCHRDCVGPAAPEPSAETSEPEHAHVCPVCGDSWLHANTDCAVICPGRTWARCPMHEGDDE